MASLTTQYIGLASPGGGRDKLGSHPLDRASLFGKAAFSWANSLISLGNARQLTPDDVWKLQDSNKVAPLLARFQETYERKNRGILRAFFSIYGKQLVLVGCMQLLSAGCDMYGPAYVLPQIIKTVQHKPMDWTTGVLLALSLYGVQVVNALLKVHMGFINNVMGIQFSACLRSMIFQKSLKLSAAARKEKNAGDIANMFSVDVIQVMGFSLGLNNVWIVPFQMFITLYLIQLQVGWAVYIGLIVLVLILLVSLLFGTIIGKSQTRILTAKDDRMNVISEFFGAIQIIKFNAWEEKFAAKVVDLRNRELGAILTFVKSLLVLVTSMYTAPVIITVVVFATYSMWMGRLLTVSVVFTTVALFKTLQQSFMSLPSTFVNMLQALVSAKRIGAVLDMEEIDLDNVATAESDLDLAKTFGQTETVVAISDGTFAWGADKVPLFEHLNWTVQRGEFVVVHGGVGAGKSSLCSILLGEMKKTHGSVFVAGRVAYFAQQSWMQNATIRENILFAKPYDAAKYRKVLDACALTMDLAALPAGDRTEIGLKGVNLSGGQKARISLARACYSDADIFFFDAPLAALDAIVANQVFQKCFLGLLKDKTVILVTHNPDVIESPAINRSFLLQDGVLVESTHDKPRIRPDDADIVVSPLRARRGYWEDVDESQWTAPPVSRTNDLLISPSAQTPHAALWGAADIWTPRVQSAANIVHASLVVEEGRAEGRVSKAVVMGYVRAIGGWQGIFVMLFSTAATEGIRVGSDMWLSHWSNQAETKSDAEFRSLTNSSMLVYSALSLGMCILTVIQLSTVYMYGLRGSKTLFMEMLASVMQAPMRFFDTNPIGRILNRFGDDIFQCDIQIPMAFAPMLVETASALNKLVTTVAIVQYMGILIPPLMYVYVKLGSYYLAPLRELNRIKKTTLSPLLSLVSQSVEGTVTIRAFGDKYQRRFYRLHDQAIETYSASCFAAITLNQWFSLRVQLISNTIVLAILMGAIIMNNRLSAGVIGLAISYGLAIPANLASLVGMWANLEAALIAPERIHEYANVPSEGQRTTPLVLEAAWPAHGQIEFDDVSFRYKPEDPLVLKHVSFSVRGGEKIGVVGRTGAGKSSLMMTLFRINEVATGTIKIDGVDIAAVGLKRLRSSLAIIPQNPVLFKGTLRNYMDPFDEFTDEQLWVALRKVNLTTRVSSDDLKLLQPVEENGENFSVGERQMLCLARALLRKAKVVVLDEATAAIDHDTDQLLQKVIRDEFSNSTVMTIAHRLDTVLDYDRIFVLDAGELVQSDSPRALFDRASGIFFDMITDGGYADRLNQATSEL
ncbi:Aste57867_14528 [Aphanomyces stellatus]|uniref:Aste57867_14528 protein n=1 Tax=Aphanomyces stellatus TaxID=120398 RepID=A0A485L0Y7_9STRA|nr:hypothetical protein As57867_014474 [Aphanomyces stellatus]VFT91350.1 Aste57867_14528 [Aphanomyces stellatus]